MCVIATVVLVSCTNDEVATTQNSSTKTDVVATEVGTNGQIPTTPPK